MPKILVLFYLFGALWLFGFGLAAVTAGAPAGVACGSISMLCFLATVAARIAAQEQPAARRTGSVRGSG